WLSTIGQLLTERPAAGKAGPPVVACSALKRSYRDLLRSHAPDVVFVHLTGEPATIAGRLNARAHEFMPSTLLESQLATLEAPGADEAHVLGDIALAPEQMVEGIVRQLAALSAHRPDQVPA
ncbi:gluconokinase, partial [Escherichia coli]|uniref:gluconokinase n=1 Tax=Escherichia coli TaxID=562 RepID=UPI0032E8222F